MPVIVGHANHAQTPKGALDMSAISAGNALFVGGSRFTTAGFIEFQVWSGRVLSKNSASLTA